jgi:hypothetical protein
MLKFRFSRIAIRGPAGRNNMSGFTTPLMKETRHRHDWNGSEHPVPNEKGAQGAPLVEGGVWKAPAV